MVFSFVEVTDDATHIRTDGDAVARVHRPAKPLTNEQVNRYKRHLILPEVGTDGQQKLLAAKVLCIGAGGLGCPIALYLAAAGVGTIGLADVDVVSPSNLQRQILFGTAQHRPGQGQGGRRPAAGPEPRREADRAQEIVDSSNVLDLVSQYDVIIDGTDNFPTRYCVNDACVLLKKPNVYGRSSGSRGW